VVAVSLVDARGNQPQRLSAQNVDYLSKVPYRKK
jgi:hypothetical protein